MHKRQINIFLSTILLLLAIPARAGTFSSDFNSGVPTGTTVNGSAVVEATGGVEGSGVLKVTKSLNGQAGSFVIDDLDGGAPVYGFDLTAKVRVGGGTSTPADGFSINFDPTATSSTSTGEEGTAGGITFAFDIYDNSNETPPAPSIDFKVTGSLIATHKMSIPDFDTGPDFVDLHIQVAADGAVSLAYKGVIVFTNIYYPNYQSLSGASFVIGARTGGLNENQWFDNLNITTYTAPKVGITRQPVSEVVLAGHDITINVAANNTDGATFQWFKNNALITGETNLSLTITNIAIANSGDKYKLTITGLNNTITSDEITLTVVDIPGPSSPQISFNFDDGATPAGTILSSLDNTIGGYITTTGGVNNSGVLHLTDAANGADGEFVINDPNAGAPVYGFTARFDALVGGGSAPPADGFSFNFASDIADVPSGAEDGVGTGLIVGFDIFDNGNENPPAPSIDVRYQGAVVSSVHFPYQQLETGAGFGEVLIHLDTDGTLDVAYKGVVIFNNLPIPGFSSISTGRFALVARTGGFNENQWVDNLQIATDLTPGAVRIASQPAPQTVLLGKTATFTVSVNTTNGTTYQWITNGVPIAGATSISYTTPATKATDSGTKIKVQVTNGASNVTSDEVALTVVDLAPPATPTLSLNFDDGATPSGTILAGQLNGAADTTSAGYISATGGVNDSGVVHIVDAVNSASGAFVIQPLLAGAEISTFIAAFDLFVGGATAPPPADGFSFNFAPDLPDTTLGGAEDGAGTGLTVGFDIYDNGNETPPAPSVDIRYKGVLVTSIHLPYQEIETGGGFIKVLVRVSADGKLDLAYGDRVLYNGLQLPNYSFIANGKFGFYARTGGLNENVWLDNVALALTKSTVLRFTTEPADVLLLPGQSNTFTALVSDPTGVTYQWLKNGTNIAGETSNTLVAGPFTAADNGAKYSVKATGPGGTITSREAVVTVVSPITISNPKISFNFDDGTVPAGAEIAGSAAVGADGALHLTDAVNGQGGSIIIPDFDSGSPVSAFTAHFSLLEGGGSAPPADGFSFVWVNDLPSGTVFGEDGSGTGLILSFDIFDNGNENPPAPSIDVRYNGTAVSTLHLSYQEMETGSTFGDVFIRVESDGTIDLQYNGRVIFNNVQLPGYAPMTNASFAIGARTGGFNENQWIDNLEIATTTGGSVVGPHLTVAKQDANIVIQWVGGGTLQSATDVVNGPWNPVPNVTGSPATVPITGSAQFFRVKL